MPEPNKRRDDSPEEIRAQQFINVRDSNYRSVYSNQTAFGSTAFDFGMTFGEIVDVNPEKNEVKVEQRVRVVMSPLHFKIFVSVCVQNLKNYETAFGRIFVPADGGAIAEVGGERVPITSSE